MSTKNDESPATTNTDIKDVQQQQQQRHCKGPCWTPTSPEKFHDAENKMYKGKASNFLK